MKKSKAASYLGFARRAGKLTLGVNSASFLKGGVYLLAVDEETQKNSLKEIEKMQKRFACPLLYFKELGTLVGKEGCRLAAVRDEGLANAILAAEADSD